MTALACPCCKRDTRYLEVGLLGCGCFLPFCDLGHCAAHPNGRCQRGRCGERLLRRGRALEAGEILVAMQFRDGHTEWFPLETNRLQSEVFGGASRGGRFHLVRLTPGRKPGELGEAVYLEAAV